jgi:hypothetical protein
MTEVRELRNTARAREGDLGQVICSTPNNHPESPVVLQRGAVRRANHY